MADVTFANSGDKSSKYQTHFPRQKLKLFFQHDNIHRLIHLTIRTEYSWLQLSCMGSEQPARTCADWAIPITKS